MVFLYFIAAINSAISSICCDGINYKYANIYTFK